MNDPYSQKGWYYVSIWRDILQGRALLQKGLIIGIGNGRSTSLWYHHWVGSGPIYKLIDKDIPESKAHWFVSHIIRNGRWYLDDVRHIIPTDLCDLILATPLSMNDTHDDFIRWIYSDSGSFTVKSAYSLQLSASPSSNASHSGFSWKNLWKIKTPFKYKMLLWNCCHGILPVAQKLSHILDFISPICCRCQTKFESHLHLFRDCWESGIFWNYIFQRMKFPTTLSWVEFFGADWNDWLCLNLAQDMSWKVVFVVGIWHIWRARNRAVF